MHGKEHQIKPTTQSSLSSQNLLENRETFEYVAKSLIAGGIAGSLAKTVVGPFDRVKILFQVSHPHVSHYAGKWNGVFQAVHKIHSIHGLRGLYRGHSAMLTRIFPYAAIQYMAYEEYKDLLGIARSVDNIPAYKRMIAGSLAGATAVTFTYPFDTIRSRFAYQVIVHEHHTIWELVTQMAGEGKWPWYSFYKGFTPTIVGIIPYGGITFFTFESLKALYKRTFEEDVKSFSKFWCGFIAGAAGQTVAYPFETVRRRMQLTNVTDHLPKHTYSIFHTFKHIIQSRGLRGLFIGLSINYIKVAPATGISFVTYEYLKKKFNIA